MEGRRMLTRTASEPLVILLIEDSETDADLVLEAVSQIGTISVEVDWQTRLSDGLERLAKGGVDLVLLDLSLPDSFSLKTLASIQSAAPTIPVVVLSGLDDKDTAIQAVQHGAQDYLVKGIVESSNLLRSMRFAIERKQAEELKRLKLEAQNTLLKSAIELAPFGVAQLDSQLTVIDTNKAFTTIFSLSSDTILGTKLTDLLKKLPEHSIKLSLALQKPFQITGFEVSLSEQQEEKFFDLSIWPCESDNLGNARSLLVLNDVTESVSQSRERDDLIFTLAHDLRVPLIGTGMALKILQKCSNGEGCLCNDHKQLLPTLAKSNENVLNMLQNLVYFHQLEADDDLIITPVALVNIFEKCISELGDQARIKDLSIKVEVPQLPSLGLDSKAIQRVIWNLLDNAIKFTPSGGSIVLSAKLKLGHLIIRVQDTGLGIAFDDQHNLFKRFWRTKDLERHGTGNGLGLYICNKIVRAHGGRITTKSKVGEGSTFSIVLPMTFTS